MRPSNQKGTKYTGWNPSNIKLSSSIVEEQATNKDNYNKLKWAHIVVSIPSSSINKSSITYNFIAQNLSTLQSCLILVKSFQQGRQLCQKLKKISSIKFYAAYNRDQLEKYIRSMESGNQLILVTTQAVINSYLKKELPSNVNFLIFQNFPQNFQMLKKNSQTQLAETNKYSGVALLFLNQYTSTKKQKQLIQANQSWFKFSQYKIKDYSDYILKQHFKKIVKKQQQKEQSKSIIDQRQSNFTGDKKQQQTQTKLKQQIDQNNHQKQKQKQQQKQPKQQQENQNGKMEEKVGQQNIGLLVTKNTMQEIQAQGPDRMIEQTIFLQVAVDETSRAHTLISLINTNSNKLHKVVVYLKDHASSLFLRQNLQQNLISNSLFVTSVFDAINKQKAFKQGKFKIFAIVGNIYDCYIKNSFVPQDVNLIINEAYPQDAQLFSRRVNKQPGKDKHGLTVVNLIPTINQAKHKSQYQSLTSYCKQNNIKMTNYNPDTQKYILQCLENSQSKQKQPLKSQQNKGNQKKENTQQNDDKQIAKSEQKYNQYAVIYDRKTNKQQTQQQQNKIQSVSSSQAQKQDKHEDDQNKNKHQQQNIQLNGGQSLEKHEQNGKTKNKGQINANNQNTIEGGHQGLSGETSQIKIMQQNNLAKPVDQQVQVNQVKQNIQKQSNILYSKSHQKIQQGKTENSILIGKGELNLKEQPDFKLIVEQQLQKSNRDLETKIVDCIIINKPNLDPITKLLTENSKIEQENKDSIVQSISTHSSSVVETLKKQIQTASCSSINKINGKLEQKNGQIKKQIQSQAKLTNCKIDGVQKELNAKMESQINAIEQQNIKTLEIIEIKKQIEKLTNQKSLQILKQVENGEQSNENRLISLQTKITETDKKKSSQLTSFANKITELQKRLKTERSKLQSQANEKNRLVLQKNSTQQKLRKTQQEKSRIQFQNKKLVQFKLKYENNIDLWAKRFDQRQKDCTKLKNQLAQKGASLNQATLNYQKLSNELRSAKQIVVQYLKSLRPKQVEKKTTIPTKSFIGSQRLQNILQQSMSVQDQVMKAQMKQTISKHFIQQKKQLRALGFDSFVFQLNQMNTNMKNSEKFITDLQSYKNIKNKGASLKSKFNKLVVDSLVKIVEENERIKYSSVISQGEKGNLQKKVRNLNDKIVETRKNGKEIILQKSVDSTNITFQNICKNINQMMTQIKMGQRELKKLSDQLQAAIIQISRLEEEKKNLLINKQKQQTRLKQEIDKIIKQKQELNRKNSQLQVKNRNIQKTLKQKLQQLQSTQTKLGVTQKYLQDLQKKYSTLQRDYKDKSDQSKGFKDKFQSKKQQLRIKCDQFVKQKQIIIKEQEDKRKELQQNCKNKVKTVEAQESQKRQNMRKQNESKLNNQQKKRNMLQYKTQQFQKGINSSIIKSLKVEPNITLDNFGQSLPNLESSIALKLSKMSFLVESELYNGYNDSEKEFVFNAVAKVVSTRVVATKTLFEGYQGGSWDQWLFKVRKRPNILMLMTLQNGHKICSFSENPFSNEESKAGSGFMSSITNRKVYPLKSSHQGKAATYDQYMFCFGRNELLVKASCTFSIILSRVFCHFQTNDVPNSEFIGQEDDEGSYKRVEFHQIFLESR